MKKIFTLSLSAIFMLATFTSCNNETPTVSLNRTSATLLVGDTLHLFANVSNVTWSSSNPAVVSVYSGMVIAGMEGVARITATTQDDTATCDIAVVATQRGCNDNTPGWGASLGTVSFHTNQEWTIEGNGITQIWSDAVTARNCQKLIFDGGLRDWVEPENSNLNADCRSNPGFPGDFFSWCAVVRFADQLCPYPWRVPTMRDFIALDIALGGTGVSQNNSVHRDKYLNVWGGAFGASTHYPEVNQGSSGSYWSQTGVGNGVDGRGLTISVYDGHIFLGIQIGKNIGVSLRCVR
ncbi:MAG: hypothetical protein FWD02_00820 [Bacteroidales bacterium]|nr:hypothetical protein [Bacteroidales bacterium]